LRKEVRLMGEEEEGLLRFGLHSISAVPVSAFVSATPSALRSGRDEPTENALAICACSVAAGGRMSLSIDTPPPPKPKTLLDLCVEEEDGGEGEAARRLDRGVEGIEADESE
jgi:hypothetical protein